jgi:ABC-type dipeptide/oligopeptide/nickel transport system permease component
MLFLTVKRLGRLLLTVFLISTTVFFILRVIPGDPALTLAGIDASTEDIEALRRTLGTDRPVGQQYLVWLSQVVRLDFGRSLIYGRSVAGLIFERFLLTLSLAVMAILISLLLAIPLGLLSASRRGGFWDFLGMGFSQIGMAVPSFWLGILLLLLFAVRLPLFPLFGSGSLFHFVLPAFSLGIARAAVLTRLTRVSVLEELAKEYVVTARSKGLTDRAVRYKHVLRNALLPVTTVSGLQLGALLGGSIIIEQVFSLPGLGRLFLFAIYNRDFPLVQGGVVFIAVLFSTVNFVVDVFYGLINPKIRVR